MTVNVSRPELPPEAEPSTPPVSLSVGDVTLAGLLGGVDIADVARRALRTRGPQQVTGESWQDMSPLPFPPPRACLTPPLSSCPAGRHSFEKLAVQEASSRGLNMDAIARTDVLLEKLPGPLRFTQPLVANKVQVG